MSKLEDFVPIYFKHIRGLSPLTNEQIGHVFRAVLQYAESGVMPELDQSCAVAVGFIIGEMEDQKANDHTESQIIEELQAEINEQANYKRLYLEMVERNRANGKKGGRPAKKQETDGFENGNSETRGFENDVLETTGFENSEDKTAGFKEEESLPLLPPEKEKKSFPPHPLIKENKEIPPIIPQKEGEDTASADADACAEPEKSASTPPPEPLLPADDPVIAMLPLNDKTEFPMTEGMAKEYAELYPAVDVPQQFRAMRAWALSNPGKRKTRRGVRAFINTWLNREQNKPHPTPRTAAPPGQEERDPFVAFMDAAARGEEWTRNDP